MMIAVHILETEKPRATDRRPGRNKKRDDDSKDYLLIRELLANRGTMNTNEIAAAMKMTREQTAKALWKMNKHYMVRKLTKKSRTLAQWALRCQQPPF
jgi:Mn-dependent DtxR family transcriptional regulator